MTYDENNLFAKILRDEIPCEKVYEDENVLAFNDKYPKAPVHILAITKKPYEDMVDFLNKAPATEIEIFFKDLSKIADEQGLSEKGYRIAINCGEIEGSMEIAHLHAHITGSK